MKKGLLITIGVVVGLLLLVGGYIAGKYNSMVKEQQNVEEMQAQVEVVLQRRFDLIPNLVNSVKSVLTQEQALIDSVTEARKAYAGAATQSTEKVEAANELESTLSRLLVVIESYPELKSDETVQGLMDELAGTENRIATERRRFNEEVTTYNKLIKTFPNNLFAGIFGFEEAVRFEATDEADEVPEVDLSLDEE
jgi:LemA protein